MSINTAALSPSPDDRLPVEPRDNLHQLARTPIPVEIDVSLITGLGVVLVCNAVGRFGLSGGGPYAAALSGILAVSAWAYLQALNTLLRHHHKPLPPAGLARR